MLLTGIWLLHFDIIVIIFTLTTKHTKMKKTLFIASAILFSAINCISQSVENTNYLQKSKNQKTAAWILLGSGAVIDIIAIATFPKDYNTLDVFGNNSPAAERQANTSTWLLIAGTATMLASIPFFILSHVNKKKAVSVTINPQQLRQLKNKYQYSVNYPALTFKIRL